MQKIKFFVVMYIGIVILFGGFHIVNATETPIPASSFLSNGVAIEVKNMVPGESHQAQVGFQNTGTQSVDYKIEFVQTDKSESATKLAKQIEMSIVNEQQVLYEGKISDFEVIKGKNLLPSNGEDLNISFSLPKETGNEYQGLETTFKFVLYGEGVGEIIATSTDSNNIDVLPRTGEGLPYVTLIGLLLIVVGIFLWKKKVI